MKTDPAIAKLIKAEEKRQSEGLEMIPSENHASGAVLAPLGTRLGDKYRNSAYPDTPLSIYHPIVFRAALNTQRGIRVCAITVFITQSCSERR